MLDRRRDDVGTSRGRCLIDAAEREVVGLGAAGREDDLVGVRADVQRNRRPSLIDGLTGPLRLDVDRRWVVPHLAQVGEHGLYYPRVGRRGGGVVEIDAV